MGISTDTVTLTAPGEFDNFGVGETWHSEGAAALAKLKKAQTVYW